MQFDNRDLRQRGKPRSVIHPQIRLRLAGDFHQTDQRRLSPHRVTLEEQFAGDPTGRANNRQRPPSRLGENTIGIASVITGEVGFGDRRCRRRGRPQHAIRMTDGQRTGRVRGWGGELAVSDRAIRVPADAASVVSGAAARGDRPCCPGGRDVGRPRGGRFGRRRPGWCFRRGHRLGRLVFPHALETGVA